MRAAAREASPSAEDRRVVFISDLGDLARLEPAWEALALDAEEPIFFQSFAWTYHVARTKLDGEQKSWRLCLSTLWDGDRLLAVWPLALQREGFCWIATCLDEPFGQLAGLLTHADLDPALAFDLIVDGLKREGLAAGLRIEHVIKASPLHRQLLDKGASVAFSDEAVFLDFRPFDTFDTYLKSVKSKTRKNLRNARNRLFRDHEVDHEITSAPHDLTMIMAEAFEGRLTWMQDHAKTAPAFRDGSFRQMLDTLPNSPLAKKLLGFRLKSAEQTISVQWGFVHQNRYYAYLSARNPAFDGYSAGRVHLGMVLETCWDRGIEVVELMAPASDYKLNWTKSVHAIDDLGLPLTASGYLYLDLWRRHGRVALKQLYQALPENLRRSFAPRAARMS